jgi:hypothetical protein
MTAAAPLYELLVALFDSDAELRRFLSLAGYEEVLYRLPVTKGGSTRTTASGAASALEAAGFVQPTLFEALERRAPDRAGDIWAVAATYGIQREPTPTAAAQPPAEAAPAGAAPLPEPQPAPLPMSAPPPPPPPTVPPERPVMTTSKRGFSLRLPRFLRRLRRAETPSAGAEVPAATSDTPPAYADFLQRLDSGLAEVTAVDPIEDALSSSRWPWTAAAAVLGSFRPTELDPLGDPVDDVRSGLTALADVVFTTPDGRWVLTDGVRSAALERLVAEGTLEAALDANADRSDPHRDWIRRLVQHEPLPSLASLDTRELGILETVVRWLDPLGLDLAVDRAAVYAMIERRFLIDPLRKLVGAHFRGREEELADIRSHIHGDGEDATMVIRGPGGSGKSSLIGKVLLELEERIAFEPISFAYVDFDKARHNPRNARGLVEQIARQLRLLYAANVEKGREFAGLESAASGTDLELAAEVLELDSSAAELDVDGLLRVLGARLEDIRPPYGPPLLLILDTFEEVEVQGPGATTGVLDLVGRFRQTLTDMRLIVSGRGAVSPFAKETEAIVELGDLDSVAADAVLEALGVPAREVRTLIYERFGGNPLTLHLAAEALRRIGTAEEAFEGALGRADALASVGVEQIQGMLYDRILGHLGDPDVVKVALPGLAVRRVDVDVIRDVLAGPCELEPSRADEIFERLQREVSMFDLEDDGKTLRHRQDVRRLMLRPMTDDPKVAQTVAEIHRLAVEFYAQRTGDAARAEEIYHRLMAGEEPRSLQELWDPKLRDALYPALEDPLPQAGRTWLRRRLGLVDIDAERGEWEQEDWEAEAAERARSWLASGDATRATDVLAEREERLPGSPLYPLEVAALIDLERFEEASRVLDEGLRSCSQANAAQTQLDLAEQAVRLAAKMEDAKGILAATESAVRLADAADEKLRGIDDLAGAYHELEELGASEEAEQVAKSISERFAAVPSDVLRGNPELVRTVVESVGATDSEVLARAAVTLGDVTSQEDALFRDDVYALSRILESTKPEGRYAMNGLALEVGLPSEEWTPFELASSAVSRGRTGKAVALALDHAVEEGATRQMIVNDLVRFGPTSSGDDHGISVPH